MLCRHAIKYWKFREHIWWGDTATNNTIDVSASASASPNTETDVNGKSKPAKSKPFWSLALPSPEPQLGDTLFRIGKNIGLFLCAFFSFWFVVGFPSTTGV
jgi:hypothetical protein